VLASITRAARRGILIKGGRHLERLAEVDAVVFDKTGTVTRGTPEVIAIEPINGAIGADGILALAASAEARLTHPMARAVVRAAKARSIAVPERARSHYAVGLGVEAVIDGILVHVGSGRFMEMNGIEIASRQETLARIEAQAASPLFVACDRQLAGLLACADPIRPEACAVIRALRSRGLETLIMVTGDH